VITVDGIPEVRWDAAGLLGDDEQLARVKAASALERIGREGEGAAVGAQLQPMRLIAVAPRDRHVGPVLDVFERLAQLVPEHVAELALAGADDDDQSVGPRVEPPEDEAGDDVAFADAIAGIDDGVAVVDQRLTDFALPFPVAGTLEDDFIENI